MTAAEFARFAGLSAWLAAAMTVVGAVTLVQFFRRGGRWGMWNDIASVVLMLAMIPVALVLTLLTIQQVTTVALAVGFIGILAMGAHAAIEALLVARRVTFEQTKGAVLALGAVVGVWYVLVAVTSASAGMPDGLRLAAAVSGAGFIAVGIGFAIGGERHPLSGLGGLALFVASLVFLLWLGALLLSGGLVIPGGNA